MYNVFTAGPRVTFQADSNDIVPPGMELGQPEGGMVQSPPVSTESISSGHYSPPVSHGDMCTSSPRSFISKSTDSVVSCLGGSVGLET